MVVFGKKWLYSGKGGCYRAKVDVFEQSCIYQEKVVLIVKSCCIRAKVVVFGQKWFFLG